jgi:CDP-glycerol glycerophosphotransferase
MPQTAALHQPDVTVVVIVYNDATHLEAAVESVLRQSWRDVEVIICDDCSTDDTPQVARSLVERDPRVRYHRLAENSGGCGAPRNAGIELSAAPYLMFLDSDDTLERHACYNLLTMAWRHGCDVVAGKCLRYYPATKKTTYWYANLYRERRVLSSIEELSTMIWDSISTNKLYKRSYLDQHDLRFPVGVKYEDMHFTTRMYATAERIGIVPEVVYVWNIYDRQIRQTITQQRDDIANTQDRMAALQAGLDAFADHSHPVDELWVKILRHDMQLCVDDVIEHTDPAYGAAVLGLIQPMLRTVPREHLAALRVMDRVCYGLALCGDVAALKQARAFRHHKGAWDGRLITFGDRTQWAPIGEWTPPAADSLEAWLVDLTDEPLLQTPCSVLRMAHVIESAELLPQGVRLRGRTADTLGKFTGCTPEMELRITMRRGSVDQIVPVSVTTRSADGWTWSVDVPGFSESNYRHSAWWWLSMRMTGAGRVNDSMLCLDAASARTSFREPSGVMRFLGGEIELYETAERDAAFRRQRIRGLPAGPVAQFLHVADRALGPDREVNKRRLARMRMAVYHAAQRLPLNERAVLFEAHMGKQVSGSPRAVFEELRRRASGLRATWSVADTRRHQSVQGARVIKRYTFAHVVALARSKYLVDNQGLPSWASKRPGQVHLQTWHGIPLKRMGLHKLEYDPPTPEIVAQLTGQANWDALVCPSDYFKRTLVDSYRYSGQLIEGGSPGNDVLVKHPEPDPGLVRRLDLPVGKRVVLYTPTFREALPNSGRAAPSPLALERWIEELGDTHYLLMRPHYLNRYALNRIYAPYLMDVSDIDEVSDLYRLADVLITDYSSAMFDYLWLDKPIVIFAPDYDEYATEDRGVYFDLRTDSPGPFCEDDASLYEVLRALPAMWPDQLPKMRQFRERYCGTEDGMASARSVDFLLSRAEEAEQQ